MSSGSQGLRRILVDRASGDSAGVVGGKLSVDTGLLQAIQSGDSLEITNDPAALALLARTGTITSAAALTITPASGSSLRLWWVLAIGDPDQSSTGSVRITLGSSEKYRSPALAHRQRFDGAADETIVVAVVGPGSFDVTIHYEEIAP